jgi:hypothetical protein
MTNEASNEAEQAQQKMLAKLEEIGTLEYVTMNGGDVVLQLSGMRLRIEQTGRVRYADGASSDRNSGAFVGLIRLREQVATAD